MRAGSVGAGRDGAHRVHSAAVTLVMTPGRFVTLMERVDGADAALGAARTGGTGRRTVPQPLSVIGAAVAGAARSRYMTGRLADSGHMHDISRQCRCAALQP